MLMNHTDFRYLCVFTMTNSYRESAEPPPNFRTYPSKSCFHPEVLLRPLKPSRGTHLHLAGEDGRAGGLVRLAAVVVDVDHEARVGGLVGAREGDEVGRGRGPAAADVDLGARDVELGAARRARAVQRHVLDPEQVVALG